MNYSQQGIILVLYEQIKIHMDDFRKLVEKYYKQNSSESISNGSIEHAKVLAKYLFRVALDKNEEVRITTGSLEKDFYENFTDIIKKILIKKKVSIISENTCANSTFQEAIEESENGSIQVFKPKKNAQIQSLPHFILVGDGAYRLETNDKLKIATASFNRPSVGEFLKSIFQAIEKT